MIIWLLITGIGAVMVNSMSMYGFLHYLSVQVFYLSGYHNANTGYIGVLVT